MPLPPLPFEIWLEIIELSCLLDIKTPTVLSQTTRELRDISRFHRYHSVRTDGHEQLLAFEKQFSSSHKDSHNIVHLLVVLPSLGGFAYADEDEKLPDTSMDSSSTYDSSSVDSDDSEDDSESVTASHPSFFESHTSSASEDTGDELEYGEMSAEEIVELGEEVRDLPQVLHPLPTLGAFQAQPTIYIWADSPLHPMDVGGQDISQLDHLSKYNLRVTDLEFKVYSALRRVLGCASPSLIQFSLFWEPHCDFTAEALFPILPKLRDLAVFEHRQTNIYTAHKILQQEFSSFPTRFPALARFDVNSIWSPNWGGTLLKSVQDVPTIRSMTLPCTILRWLLELKCLRRFLPKTVQALRIKCECASFTQRQCNLEGTPKPLGQVGEIQLSTSLGKSELELEWEDRRYLY